MTRSIMTAERSQMGPCRQQRLCVGLRGAAVRVTWVLLLFPVLAVSQGTGEWDGVMSPAAEDHLRLGQTAMQRHDLRTALQEFRVALRYSPKAVPIHNALGEAYLASGEVDKAVVEFRIAIALGPRFTAAYWNMGRALERRKDFVGAQSFYEGALRLEPEWPGAHIALGRALRLQGKLSESKKELEKALAADPDSREARDELDLTERKLKRPPEMKTREGPRPTS